MSSVPNYRSLLIHFCVGKSAKRHRTAGFPLAKKSRVGQAVVHVPRIRRPQPPPNQIPKLAVPGRKKLLCSQKRRSPPPPPLPLLTSALAFDSFCRHSPLAVSTTKGSLQNACPNGDNALANGLPGLGPHFVVVAGGKQSSRWANRKRHREMTEDEKPLIQFQRRRWTTATQWMSCGKS
jgi:hypothetical protein